MQTVLHILTRKEDSLAQTLIEEQQQQSGVTVRTFDLTQPQPDYERLLEEIFQADSVQVW
jgi:hypothetical protein